MSSKGKRLDQPNAVSAFTWGAAAAAAYTQAPAPAPEPFAGMPEAMPMEAPAPVEPTVDTAAIEREAFAQGYAQGERAGAEAAAKRGEAMLRRLTQTIEELTVLRAEMIRHTERQMVHLALAVARRVLHREVSLDPDLLIAMARVALERLGESSAVTIRLNPDDYAATIGTHAADLGGSTVSVVADTRVSRGGCRIESDFGTLESGVDAQIQELTRALLGDESVADPSEVSVG